MAFLPLNPRTADRMTLGVQTCGAWPYRHFTIPYATGSSILWRTVSIEIVRVKSSNLTRSAIGPARRKLVAIIPFGSATRISLSSRANRMIFATRLSPAHASRCWSMVRVVDHVFRQCGHQQSSSLRARGTVATTE